MSGAEDVEAGPTSELASFASELRFDQIPQAVVDKQVLHTLDGLGNGLYGSSTPFAAKMIAASARAKSIPEAAVWGTDLRMSVEAATTLNASFANVNELEDAHHRTKFKPNTVLVPATVAFAEATNRSGADVIAALVAGSEVGIRVGEAIHSASDAYSRGWLGTGALGAMATAASLANLMRLSPLQTAHALALGANMPTGIWASGLTPAKRAMIGRAAANGVVAAYMAAEGIEAGPEVLAAEWGSLGDVLSGVTEPELFTSRLGSYWKTAEVGLEWYPTKGALHSSIDAILSIYAAHDIDPQRIRSVRVATARSIVNNPALHQFPPIDVWAAQHSLRYCLAVTLLEKACTSSQFRSELLTSTAVAAMADRIEVESSDEATRLYPTTKTAIVDITLDDGSGFSERVDYCTGEPENFPTRERIIQKFRDAANVVLDDMQQTAVVAHVTDITTSPVIRQLTESLAVHGRGSISEYA